MDLLFVCVSVDGLECSDHELCPGCFYSKVNRLLSLGILVAFGDL